MSILTGTFSLVGLGTFPAYLLCGFILLVVAIKVIDTIFFVKIEVVLKTRKDYNEFDPDSYLWQLPRASFERVQEIASPESKKQWLVLKWKYTTPSGKYTRSGQKTYNKKKLRGYLSHKTALVSEGLEKIPALNKQYADALSRGREVGSKVPKIYCYRINNSPEHVGLVKVGYTSSNALRRIRNQLKTAAHLKVDYDVLFVMPAVTVSNNKFMDHEVHRILKSRGIDNPFGEWFRCSGEQAAAAVNEAQGLTASNN